MDIGLVMLVKDEALRVEDALAPILDQLAAVVVFDTGSTDGTPDLLRERLQIEPLTGSLDPDRCGCLCDLRNRGLAMLSTPWRMTLDADERIDPDGFHRLRRRRDPADTAGLFLRWHNVLEDGTTFEDYKCAVFRDGIRKRGLIHDNVQPSLRRAGAVAHWADELTLEHRPEARKTPAKRRTYRARLACAMQHEPEVPRYPWFAGYQALREGRREEAIALLIRAATSDHPLFPVERLNAAIVLVHALAEEGRLDEAGSLLRRTAGLHATLASDFEVVINRWMAPWLANAPAALAAGDLAGLRPPRFAC